MFADFYKEYERARNSKELNKQIPKIRNFNKVIFCGVGGSGAPGEILSSLNSTIHLPVFQSREKLPLWADTKTLCFIISYSGDTKETINLYNQAKKKNCKIVIITSGGKLSKKSEAKILIPKGFLPREALPYFLYPMLNILDLNPEIRKPKSGKKTKEDESKIINDIIYEIKKNKKFPIIYSSSESLKPAAYIWQTQLNENSKTFAHSNYFPELAHNEIESEFPKNSIHILLKDSKNPENKNTIRKARSKKLIKPIEVPLKGRNVLEKMIYGIHIGEKISYFLAKEKGVDWKKIPRIEKLK